MFLFITERNDTIMACFIAPAVEAAAAAVVTKIVKKKEENSTVVNSISGKIPFSRKLKWLTNMLWGGSALLAFEHVWHGEVVPYFPFLTAMLNKADTFEMLKEIATTGVTMAALVTAAWGGMLGVAHILENNAEVSKVSETAEK